jgi:hypothetical protein
MVRVLCYILLLWFITGCGSLKRNSTSDFDQLNIRPHYQINYNLASGGERYQFIVDLIEMEPYRTFKFTMTNSNETSALIAITPQALDSGNVEKNYFPSFSDTLDNNTLTVWFSKTMFNNIVEHDTAYFNGNYSGFGNRISKFYNAGSQNYIYELNGVPQNVEVIYVKEVSDRPKEFWVLNNLNNPLIVKMNIGWEIWLKEVNHNYE